MAYTKRYVNAVAAHLETKLHGPNIGYRCRCGQCRHQILVTAQRLQIPPQRLISALTPERPPQKEQPKPRARRMSVAVAESATVTRGRTRLTSSGAILVLLAS